MKARYAQLKGLLLVMPSNELEILATLWVRNAFIGSPLTPYHDFGHLHYGEKFPNNHPLLFCTSPSDPPSAISAPRKTLPAFPVTSYT